MAKYILGLILTLVAVAGFAYVRYAPPPYRGTDPALSATEEALATPETLALGSVDLTYVQTLKTKYFGTADAADLPSPAGEPVSTAESLRAAILGSGVASRASFAFYLTSTGHVESIEVVDGNFSVQKIAAALQRTGSATPLAGRPNSWMVRFEDVESCTMSAPWTVLAGPQRVIAFSGDDRSFVARVERNAKAARNLARWREFRAERFAAAAVFLPKNLPTGGIDPLVQMSAKMAKKQLLDLDEIYVGAAVHPLLVRGTLSLWLSTRTPEAAAQKASEWQQSLAASRARWAEVLPTAAAMHDHASIAARGNLITSDITLDRQLAGELRKLPGELIGAMFGASA